MVAPLFRQLKIAVSNKTAAAAQAVSVSSLRLPHCWASWPLGAIVPSNGVPLTRVSIVVVGYLISGWKQKSIAVQSK
jgi:hypothetical protein